MSDEAEPEGQGRREGVVAYLNHQGERRIVRGHVVVEQNVVRVVRHTGVITIPLSRTLEVFSPSDGEVD